MLLSTSIPIHIIYQGVAFLLYVTLQYVREKAVLCLVLRILCSCIYQAQARQSLLSLNASQGGQIKLQIVGKGKLLIMIRREK